MILITWLSRMAILPVILVLFACSVPTTRMLPNPNPLEADLGLHANSDGAEVQLHHIIVKNGPGSWHSDAIWDEYVFSFKNGRKTGDVSVGSVSIVDVNGVHVNPLPYVHHGMLMPTPSEMQQKQSDNMASQMAQGTATGILLPSLLSALPMGALVGAGGYITQGILGFGASYPGMAKASAEAKDQDQLKAELEKRKFASNLTLSPGGLVREKSIFFPPGTKPREVIVNFRISDREVRQVRIPLGSSPNLVAIK